MRAKEAAFLLGFLCGCLVMNIYFGAKLEQVYQERDTLLASIADKDSRLEHLEKALAGSGSLIIKEIQPNIILKGNRPLQLELEKMTRQWLDIFLGRELSSLDPAAIPFIIDGRTVTINDQRIHLHVETTIISDKLIIFIRPEIENNLPDG